MPSKLWCNHPRKIGHPRVEPRIWTQQRFFVYISSLQYSCCKNNIKVELQKTYTGTFTVDVGLDIFFFQVFFEKKRRSKFRVGRVVLVLRLRFGLMRVHVLPCLLCLLVLFSVFCFLFFSNMAFVLFFVLFDVVWPSHGLIQTL